MISEIDHLLKMLSSSAISGFMPLEQAGSHCVTIMTTGEARCGDYVVNKPSLIPAKQTI